MANNPQLNALDVVEQARKLAENGDTEGAAKYLQTTLGIELPQARANVSGFTNKTPVANVASPTGIWGGDVTRGTGNPTITALNAGSNTGAPITPAGAPAPAAPQQPATTQQTTPLPSSQYQQVLQPTAPVDLSGIRDRASRDAHLQIQALIDQANTGYNRFASEGQQQVQNIRNAYAPQYQQNIDNTEMAARGAVQDMASRGFLVSGMAEDANLKSRLAGERDRMMLALDESSQVGNIMNRINQAGQERNDTLSSLSHQEQALIGKLMDQYQQSALDNNYRDRALNSQNALQLLGMDTDWNKFQQGLQWQKDSFGQQLGFDKQVHSDQMGLSQQQLAEEIASRLAAQQIQRDQMSQQQSQWAGDNKYRYDSLGQANDQFLKDLGYKDKWWQGDNALAQQQLNYQNNWHAQDYSLGQGNLTLGRDRLAQDQTQFDRQQTLNEREMNMVGQQLTSQYMGQVDDILSRAQDPAIIQQGLNTPQGIVKYFRDHGMKISAEGADLNSIISYIQKRTGYSPALPLPSGTGPLNSTSKILFGIR